MVDNAEDVAKETVRQTAFQKEQQAYEREARYEEMKVQNVGNVQAAKEIDEARLEAAAARREADAYVSEADLDDATIKGIREAFLNRWMDALERQHISHSAILKVKQTLGEPTADYDSTLAQLDRGHALASSMLEELNKPVAKKRPVPKA